MDNLTCKICNNSNENTSFRFQELNYGFRDEFTYFQCKKCGCLQIKSFPENISDYYPNDYYSFGVYDGRKFKGVLGLLKKTQYKLLVLGNNSIKKLLKPFSGLHNYHIFYNININRDSNILDVGCGNGKSFLFPLAEIGFKNLKGCDPFIGKNIVYDNGLTIEKSNIFAMNGHWDVITYHHSFEHVSNPQEHLDAIKRLLKPNGVCIIRIPTVSSFAWKHYGKYWVQIDAPRHFFLHSNESMHQLAKQTGLDLFKIEYDSNHFQFLGSELYKSGMRLIEPRPKGFANMIKRKIKKYQYKRKAKSLNKTMQGDQAAYFLRNSISS